MKGVAIFTAFKNFAQAQHFLFNEAPKTPREIFGSSERIGQNIKTARLFGDPQNIHRAVHVAGTSGKGSVCYLIDTLLRAHSKRTGLMISPHVYNIRERIQINGQLISEKKFTETCNNVVSATKEKGEVLTYFEILTFMGFITAAHSNIDYLIVETGLGGRLDTTNVIDRQDKICVITQVGLDHTEALGNTLAAIATEKVGIIQQGSVVVALRQTEEVNNVITKRCLDQNAQLVWIEPAEDYQKTNDTIATTVVEILARNDNWEFKNELAANAFTHIFIPGRFEKRDFKNHLLVLDGAHNPQKLAALASHIERSGLGKFTVVFAIASRKDLHACLETLKPITNRIIITSFSTSQQDIQRDLTTPKEILGVCRELGIEAETSDTPETALHLAAKYTEPIIATGSFYLLHEIDAAM